MTTARRATALVLMSTLLALGSFTSAAVADETTHAGVGVAPFVKCDGMHCIAGQINVRVYPSGGAKDVVEWECTVVGNTTAIAVTIDACSVGARALLEGHTLPGPANGSAGAGLFQAGSTPEACVAGTVVFAEQILGDSPLSDGDCQNVLVVSV